MRGSFLKLLGQCMILVVGSAVSISYAAPAANCEAALIQDKMSLKLNEASTLAVVKLITENTAASDSIGGELEIPGLVGIGLTTAKGASKSYFEDSKIEWDQKRLISVATQVLSSNAVEAYKICKDGQHHSGPRITVHSATATAVTVEIHWKAPVGAPTSAEAEIAVVDGALNGEFPTTWENGQAFSRVVSREPGEDLRITADIGGETDSEFIAMFPPPPIAAPKRLILGSCLGKGGWSSLRFWGPDSEYCNGLKEWGRYDAQVQEVREIGSCKGYGGFNGITLYGPVGEHCAGLEEWGAYETSVDVYDTGISACKGHGGLAGHLFWGPRGAVCAGIQSWGYYDQFKIAPE